MENSLAAGFRTSPVEIAAFFLIVILFVVALVSYGIHRHRVYLRRRAKENSRRYAELVVARKLLPTDEDLVDRLARYLRDPSDKHIILQSQSVFNQTAALALDDGVAGPGQVSALRVKLGFTGRPVGLRPRSSTEIPPSSPVILETAGNTRFEGQVTGAATDSLRVRLKDRHVTIPSGASLRVIYQNDAGVFNFNSTVLLKDDNEIGLQHSEEIESVQHRSHYRRPVNLPVYIRSALSDDEPKLSRFVDIGGGGASIRNPGGRFSTGDTVELTFHPDGDTTLDLVATVVRTSRRGKVIHLRYGNIRESDRDRVYRLMFRPSDKSEDR
jgi:c-di-GMP-binding flagellar brake protein YcgR